MTTIFHLFPIVSLALYLAAAAAYVRELLPSAKEEEGMQYGRRLLLAGFLLHLVALLFDEVAALLRPESVAHVSTVLSFPFTLSLIAGLLVGSFLLLQRRLAISALGVFVAPAAVAFMIAAGVLFHLDRGASPTFSPDSLLLFHIGLVVLGHVAFLFAFGVSVALIIQESLLKNKRLTKVQRKLPSLRMLDYLNRNFLSGGFVCMIAGVVAGLVFGFANDIAMFGLNTRVFWSLLTLGIYALLLGGIMLGGLRGRRAAWLSVAGFCSVLLSFVGVYLLGGVSFHVH